MVDLFTEKGISFNVSPCNIIKFTEVHTELFMTLIELHIQFSINCTPIDGCPQI